MVGIAFCLTSCSASDGRRLAAVLSANDPISASKVWAADKAQAYATNPQILARDIEKLKHFFAEVRKIWGDRQETPGSKKYVKYTQGYRDRAIVDFESGVIRVETLAQTQVEQALKQAIVTALLTPEDPESVDLFSDKAVSYTSTPYLYGQVKDQDGKSIAYAWRANRYADYLIRQGVKHYKVQYRRAAYVEFKLVRDHLTQRKHKYAPLVRKASQKYKISEPLIYAVIQTESSFNPYAVSGAPAYGLMQLVPSTAGKDVFEKVKGINGQPTPNYLFKPENNIDMGTAYLHLLKTRYLKHISHPESRHYAAISAYNGGAGNVLKTFSSDRSKARDKINALSPQAVFRQLVNQHPSQESRRYLQKVTLAERKFDRS